MTPETLLLVGLTGCGKTTYLDELRLDGWLTFDDFKAGAIDNSPAFQKSARFETLVARLRDGCSCVIADIDFCRSESRTEAENVLRATVRGVEIRWLFFANDERTCEENIRRRNSDSFKEDLRKLREYSSVYSIP